MLRVSAMVLVVYGGLLVLTCWGFTRAPSGFIPMQDKGYLLVNVQLPDAASVERTERVMHRIEEIARKTPGVKHTVAIAGQSILLGANAPNFGAMYVMLDDFHDRAAAGLSGDAIAAAVAGRFPAGDQGRAGQRLRRPAGRRPGHRRRLQDHRRGPRRQRPAGACSTPARRSSTTRQTIDPQLQGLFSSFRADTPWLFLDIDRDQAKIAWACRWASCSTRCRSISGSLYVNDFNRFGRTWQVNVQADADYRKQVGRPQATEGPQRSRADGAAGHAGQRPRRSAGPVMIQRYNMYPSAADQRRRRRRASAPARPSA